LCTFDKGICPQWVSTDCKHVACFQARSVSSMQLGPTYDHTNKSADGWSAYAVPGANGGFREARLTRMVQGPFCFTGWYHQSGTQYTMAVFSVDHLKSHTSKNFHDSQPEMYGRWRRVRYSESRTDKFVIDIRYYTMKPPQKGVFAVDDLSLDDKVCTEPKDGSCDFDWGDSCGYDLGNERYGKWQLEDQKRVSFRGGLLYLELKGNETSAMLTSPKLTGRRETQCLDFRYRLPQNNGENNAYLLHVFVQGSPEAHWAWPTNELSKGSWSTKEISFKQENDFRVIIQCAIKGRSFFKSYCAIDGIKLRDCQGKRAENDSFCDFEDGWCSWKSLRFTSSRFSWLLGGGNTKTTMARPSIDHTYGNATGSYVFFSNYEQKLGDEGDLIKERGHPQNGRWVALLCPTGIGWFSGRVLVLRQRQRSSHSMILPSCTVIGVTPSQKAARPFLQLELVTCDFYDWNFCKWSSMGSSTPKWVFGLNRSSTLGPLSYPSDRTKGGTVYITGSRLATVQGAAALQSPMVGPQSEPACFSFWYHMFGGRGAWLQLTLEKSSTTDSAKKTLLLFLQRDRTTADRWYNVRRTVSLESVHNKMVFTVATFPPLRKDAVVALGPIELTMGACDVLTDGRGYCDFEFDTCSWTAAATWKRMRTFTSMVGTDAFSGPVNSLYCLTATPTNAPRDGALLTSPEWAGQRQPQCLEFWWKSRQRGRVKLCGSCRHTPRKDWMFARAQISQDKTFQVVFRAKFGSDPAQFVSLDNVILRPEPCVHPAECDFNDGLCGYVNQYKGNFRWLVGTGRYELPKLQPAVPREKDTPPFAYLDLTTGTSDAVRPVTNSMTGDPNTVGLRSPLFDVTKDDTQLTIRYYRRGPNIITANASITCYGKASDRSQPQLQSSTEMDEVTSSAPAVKPGETTDSPTRCTFEDGTMCGWNHGKLSNAWVLNDPSKKPPDYPRFDHTLKAYRGRFVYTKHDVDYVFASGCLQTIQVSSTSTFGQEFNRLYTGSVRSSHHWEHVLVNFKKPEGKFQLWISFFMGKALVALDDIEVSSGYCKQR
ncbi:hypothetical protein MTO96_040036, partial [Rhipicephalus appendiculatus]